MYLIKKLLKLIKNYLVFEVFSAPQASEVFLFLKRCCIDLNLKLDEFCSCSACPPNWRVFLYMRLEHLSKHSALKKRVEAGRHSLFWSSLDYKTRQYLEWRDHIAPDEQLNVVVDKAIFEYDHEYLKAAQDFGQNQRLVHRISAAQELGDLYNFCSVINYEITKELPSVSLGIGTSNQLQQYARNQIQTHNISGLNDLGFTFKEAFNHLKNFKDTKNTHELFWAARTIMLTSAIGAELLGFRIDDVAYAKHLRNTILKYPIKDSRKGQEYLRNGHSEVKFWFDRFTSAYSDLDLNEAAEDEKIGLDLDEVFVAMILLTGFSPSQLYDQHLTLRSNLQLWVQNLKRSALDTAVGIMFSERQRRMLDY